VNWTAILVLSGGAYLFKVVGFVAGDRLAVRLAPVASLLPAALFAAIIAIMSVVIDGERFPTGINERAPWMANLLTTLGERFVSHDESDSHPALALACLCSPKADTFAQYTRWTRLLSPEIDALRVAKAGENTAIFIAGNRPLSRFGPRAVRAAEWAATAAMGGADVMWMGSHDERAEQLVLGDACALEQLWTVCPQGEIRPQPGDGPKSVLPLAKI